jgi:Na+/proline symporter
MIVMMVGLVVALGTAVSLLPSDVSFLDAVTLAGAAGKLAVFDFHMSFSTTYTFLGALLGGALLSAASHGTDHLIVQRLLATKSLGDARRALVGSGVLVIGQFALFLFVGTMLWAAGIDDGSGTSDRLFPMFVAEHMTPGLSGLVIAGILAAAMSTVSSSLNSLASAVTHDFYAPLTGNRDPTHLLRVGRWATLGWAIVLSSIALLFRSTDTPAVELALAIASITYGALLGTYMLGGLVQRARQRDALVAIAVAVGTMLVIVLGKPGPFAGLAWPWYVPLGLGITLLVGSISSLIPASERRVPR